MISAWQGMSITVRVLAVHNTLQRKDVVCKEPALKRPIHEYREMQWFNIIVFCNQGEHESLPSSGLGLCLTRTSVLPSCCVFHDTQQYSNLQSSKSWTEDTHINMKTAVIDTHLKTPMYQN